MKNTALGIAGARPHHSFSLDIDLAGDPTTQPSGRGLARAAHAWLDSMDANALLEQLRNDGYDQLPTLEWTHEHGAFKCAPSL